jgi:dihydrofolate reductase
MKLAFVVAMSQNRVIGIDNQLPWRLPEDLKWFKRVTLGHPIIMGRKTYESIGRPLPGRTNIVVTRQKQWSQEGAVVAHGIDSALEKAVNQARRDGVDEIYIIGGEELFRQSFNKVDRLYLTQVQAHLDGDAFFPEFDGSDWREVDREDHLADPQNPYDYSFIVLDRCSG